jgi:hypothetical protein
VALGALLYRGVERTIIKSFLGLTARSALGHENVPMSNHLIWRLGAILLLTGLSTGCDQLGMGKETTPQQPEVPAASELQKIGYLPSEAGPNGRKLYNQFAKAKSCGDFELAMRWNRPPNIAGGPFGKKMAYLGAASPANLPDDSEVFLRATIVKGAELVGGGQSWYLRMQDGTVVQAVEITDYLQKQEEDTQGDRLGALNQPNKPGRVFCGHGIYKGIQGKGPDEADKKVPLFSMLYALDRDK